MSADTWELVCASIIFHGFLRPNHHKVPTIAPDDTRDLALGYDRSTAAFPPALEASVQDPLPPFASRSVEAEGEEEAAAMIDADSLLFAFRLFSSFLFLLCLGERDLDFKDSATSCWAEIRERKRCFGPS